MASNRRLPRATQRLLRPFPNRIQARGVRIDGSLLGIPGSRLLFADRPSHLQSGSPPGAFGVCAICRCSRAFTARRSREVDDVPARLTTFPHVAGVPQVDDVPRGLSTSPRVDDVPRGLRHSHALTTFPGGLPAFPHVTTSHGGLPASPRVADVPTWVAAFPHIDDVPRGFADIPMH